MIDLHVHSTCSDGTFTPTELVDYAIKKGLSAFALTDHDVVSGIKEAVSYAEKLRSQGVENVPEVIPGIEISSMWGDKDIHVVGLYIDPDSNILAGFSKQFVESRENRNKKMCERLTEAGFEISYDELKKLNPNTIITRAHFATLLVEKGYAKSKNEVFERLIGDNCPYFVQRESVTPEEAVELILASGGVPVLAHPILYRLSDSTLEGLARNMKAHGLIAIEAFYSTYKPSEERDIIKLTEKLDLRLSGGSDFHGANKEKIDLGTGLGKLYIDDQVLTGIKESRKNLLFTDLDGTLLLNDSTISDKMREKLKEMTARGHKLVLTSGRPLPSILERIKTLDIDFPNVYVIANNGGLIYDYENKKILKGEKLSQDLLRIAVDLAHKEGIHVHAYTDDAIVGTTDDDELTYYMKRIHMPFIKVSDIADYLPEGTYKVQIIHLTDKQRLEALRIKLRAALGDKVEIYFTNDYYLEVFPAGVGKGQALTTLTDHLAMLRTHTFAAGDAENDISMIKAAATGISMANADPEVKEAADIVTTETNDHDGLIEIIDKYFI